MYSRKTTPHNAVLSPLVAGGTVACYLQLNALLLRKVASFAALRIMILKQTKLNCFCVLKWMVFQLMRRARVHSSCVCFQWGASCCLPCAPELSEAVGTAPDQATTYLLLKRLSSRKPPISTSTQAYWSISYSTSSLPAFWCHTHLCLYLRLGNTQPLTVKLDTFFLNANDIYLISFNDHLDVVCCKRSF